MSKRLDEALKVLRERWQELPAKQHEFASSLLSWHESKGYLTEKQWVWIERLADVIRWKDVPDFTVDMAQELQQFG